MKIKNYYHFVLLFFFTIPQFSFSQTLTLSDSLKAHFKFDGDVLDATVNNEDLSTPISPDYRVILGSDSAYYFDGSSRLNSQNQFDNSSYTEAAISLWLRSSNTANRKQMLLQGAYLEFGVFINSSNQIAAFFDPPSSGALTSNVTILDNKWHHIVAQNDGDTTFIYVDGVFKSKKFQPLDVGTGNSSREKLYFGKTNLNTHNYTGLINEVRIYNRVLSQAEIDSLSTFTCKMTSTISTFTDVSCLGGNNGSVTVSIDSGTANYNYTWSNNMNTSNVTDTFNTISGLSAGKYFVTITDTNYCSTVDSTTVIVLDSIVATRDTLILTACDNYTWAQNNQMYSNSGFYRDTSLSALSCDSVYHILDLSINSSTRSTDTVITCDSITWRDGKTYYSNNNSAKDTLVNILGCDSIITLYLTIPTVDLTVDRTGDSLHAIQTGNTYQWIDCGNGDTLISGATSIGFKPGVSGDFAVIIDNGICFDTSACIEFKPCMLTTSFVSQVNVSCNGGLDGALTVSVNSGSANYSYNWSDGTTTLNVSDTFNTINNLVAGKYYVTITDVNKCTIVDSATISEPTALNVSINIDSLPSSNGAFDGGLTATASGGTPPYTYAWIIAATTPSLTGLAAGTYTITVSDSNNCIGIASALLTEPDSLTCSTNVVNTSCSAGNDGSLTILPAGGVAPYSYLWNNSDTTATIDSLTAGTYSVTLTDNNGITSSCNGVVNSPSPIVVNLTSSDVTCIGLTDGSISASTSGGTSPYSYLWSNLANTSSISSLPAASYAVTVNDANGCTVKDSVSINLLDSTIAIYDTLNASECDNYTWAKNNQMYSSSGFYRDTSLSVSGCDSIYHILDLTINPTTRYTDTIIACDSIVWINGITYFSSNNTATDTLINSLGCDSIITLSLSILNLDLTVVNAGDSLYALQAGNTYQWIDCGNGDTIIPNATAKGFKPRISGDFAVIINNGACFDTSACNLIRSVGLEQITTEPGFSIYPNPASEKIIIMSKNSKAEIAQIISITGAILLEFTITQEKETVNLSGFKNGIYFLKLGSQTNKIIVAN